MYIDAYHSGDVVHVVERDASGERRKKRYPAPYFFYTEPDDHSTATHRSIDGKPLIVQRFSKRWDMKNTVESLKDAGVQLYESDVRTEYKLLEAEYAGKPAPKLRCAIVDIEIYSQSFGFPSWDNSRAPINAVSVHYLWNDITATLVVPPPSMSVQTLQSMVDAAGITDTFVVESESDLLAMMIDLISECDVITGWNTDRFDIPYIISRIRQVLGGERYEALFKEKPKTYDPQYKEYSDESAAWVNKLSPLGFLPKRSYDFENGSRYIKFSFPGRPQLDYLGLYQKFVLEPRDSHKLGEILEVELGIGKVEFKGSLDNLYETNPIKFIEYNRRDVVGIADLDKKLGLIEIANATTHRACVMLSDAVGSVSKIEQAILIRLHSFGKIAKDKSAVEDSISAAGAWVYPPKADLYDWVANFDVKSLYPSVIRLINISQETLVGQFRLSATEQKIKALAAAGATGAQLWQDFTGVLEYHAIVDEDPWQTLTLVLENGEEITLPADKWKAALKEMGFLLSANGTVFSSSEQGIIPLCISEWFEERKAFQKKAKEAKAKMAKAETEEEREALRKEQAYWDLQQASMKVFLNSTYGALLSVYFRWFDRRMGQSVTLSGRVISKHLYRQVNKELEGRYEFGKSIIYGDTDSVYMTLAGKSPKSVDEAVAIADDTRAKVDSTLEEFVQNSFFAPKNTITIEREIVASKGLFRNKKKRYALWVVDKEHDRKQFMKSVGMDNKRTEIPKFVRKFLSDCMIAVVKDNKGEIDIRNMVSKFQEEMLSIEPWKLGFYSKVSNVEAGTELKKVAMLQGNKAKLHHGVSAADCTNRYIKFYNDTNMDYIRDGDRVAILALLPDSGRNPLEAKTIALGLDVTPSDWFKRLPFDTETNLETVLFKKLDITFDGLGWNVRPSKIAADDLFM